MTVMPSAEIDEDRRFARSANKVTPLIDSCTDTRDREPHKHHIAHQKERLQRNRELTGHAQLLQKKRYETGHDHEMRSRYRHEVRKPRYFDAVVEARIEEPRALS